MTLAETCDRIEAAFCNYDHAPRCWSEREHLLTLVELGQLQRAVIDAGPPKYVPGQPGEWEQLWKRFEALKARVLEIIKK